MNRIYRVLCIALLLVQAFSAPAAAGESGGGLFSDVPDSHWAAPKIKLMAKRNWVSGYNDGTFRPERFVTRAELAVMIVHAAGQKNPASGLPGFTDVNNQHWAFSFVEAARNCFINDPSLKNGRFRPDDYATRLEAVAAISMAKKYTEQEAGPEVLQSVFKDYEKILPEYVKVVNLAVKNRLVKGYDDGTFRPGQPLTRSEAAVLIYNAFLGQVTVEALVKSGLISSFDQSPAGFDRITSYLDSRFANIEGIEIKYYAREMQLQAGRSDNPILIFARVDPFKYFSFSEAVFSPNPEKAKAFAEKTALAASAIYPDREVIVILGYKNNTFYDSTEVYGKEYTMYSPDTGIAKVERFYAGAMGYYGILVDSWQASS